MRAMLNN
jgi:hypothetical protein